jgi:hypothetical protein
MTMPVYQTKIHAALMTWLTALMTGNGMDHLLQVVINTVVLNQQNGAKI